ncbi:hypothetical protein D6C77_10749 [Aureobasidium pullulans]|nr:hypothetical protein D6C77_10749 [Aureobasidium pullulans]
MAFAPFPNHVAVREIDLLALDNSDSDWDQGKRADATIYTKLDDQLFLKRLTVRFNEFLDEIRQNDPEDDVLKLMNCDEVKFVGGLPVGYVYVSKPRRARKNKDKKTSSKEGKGEKPKVRKTTPDKYLFGHPHADAVPYDSVTKFVKHAFWLIHGRTRNPINSIRPTHLWGYGEATRT